MFKWLSGRLRAAREAREERATHNDRDFLCKYWWGDRSGSLVGVTKEQCEPCKREYELNCDNHTHPLFGECANGLSKMDYIRKLDREESADGR